MLHLAAEDDGEINLIELFPGLEPLLIIWLSHEVK